MAIERPMQILLIEDNPADVELTELAIHENKILAKLNVASNGEEALSYLMRMGPYGAALRPDLIMLDLNLPGLDGREVLRTVKSDPELKQIPIIILTSSESDVDVLKAYSLGANCYISKPVQYDAFSLVLRKIENFWFQVVQLHGGTIGVRPAPAQGSIFYFKLSKRLGRTLEKARAA
jgi:two-component system, chemotaxis family, response regulator Rcp1